MLPVAYPAAVLALLLAAAFWPFPQSSVLTKERRSTPPSPPPDACLVAKTTAITLDGPASATAIYFHLELLREKKLEATFHLPALLSSPVDKNIVAAYQAVISENQTLGLFWDDFDPRNSLNDFEKSLIASEEWMYLNTNKHPKLLRISASYHTPEVRQRIQELGFQLTHYRIDLTDQDCAAPSPNDKSLIISKIMSLEGNNNSPNSLIVRNSATCTKNPTYADALRSLAEQYKINLVSMDSCLGFAMPIPTTPARATTPLATETSVDDASSANSRNSASNKDGESDASTSAAPASARARYRELIYLIRAISIIAAIVMAL